MFRLDVGIYALFDRRRPFANAHTDDVIEPHADGTARVLCEVTSITEGREHSVQRANKFSIRK